MLSQRRINVFEIAERKDLVGGECVRISHVLAAKKPTASSQLGNRGYDFELLVEDEFKPTGITKMRYSFGMKTCSFGNRRRSTPAL